MKLREPFKRNSEEQRIPIYRSDKVSTFHFIFIVTVLFLQDDINLRHIFEEYVSLVVKKVKNCV